MKVEPAAVTTPMQVISSDPYFIHTAVLPMLNVTLFEALVANFPLCGNTLDCIRADASHIDSVVQAISTLTQNNDIHHANFASHHMICILSKLRRQVLATKSDIYCHWMQRLIVCVFVHIMLCTNDNMSIISLWINSRSDNFILQAFRAI